MKDFHAHLITVCVSEMIFPSINFMNLRYMCVIRILFLSAPLLVGYKTCNSCEIVRKSKSTLVAIRLILSGAYMNILFIMEVEILFLIKWFSQLR